MSESGSQLQMKKDKENIVIGDPAKDLMRITIDEFYKDL